MSTHRDTRENPFTASPALDLVRRLALVNTANRSGIVDLITDRPATGPQFLPSPPAFLLELGEALGLRQLFPAPDLNRVVGALKVIHAAFQATKSADGAGYEKGHRRFRELETKLREQSNAVDRLLGPVDPGKAVVHTLQQTLFLQCPQGGKTAGRFRCVNKTGGPAYVDIRARACRGREAGPLDQVVIGFEPAGRRLEPQEAAIFSAVIDLGNCGEIANETIEATADVYVSNELTLKLFICIEVYSDTSKDSERH